MMAADSPGGHFGKRSHCAWHALACLIFCAALLVLSIVALPELAAAQDELTPKTPYATLDRSAVAYRGPGRETVANLPGTTVKIGLLLPLQGARASEGQSLLEAAKLALAEEKAAGPLTDGRHMELAVRNEAERWGQASSEMVQLISEEQVAALITSSDGNIAHQAEQIANKIGIPIVTLASDATTTRINIPWIFRMGPSDEDQSRAIAAQVYRDGGVKKVLLLVETDHDGRVGAEEFEKAVQHLQGAPPERLEIASSELHLETIAAQVNASEAKAIVLWTSSPLAGRILSILRQGDLVRPIYLCRKAAGLVAGNAFASSEEETLARNQIPGGVWVTASAAGATNKATSQFAKRYREKTGVWPSSEALQIYDAVRLVAKSLRVTGANRTRLRDYLAAGNRFDGLSGTTVFDSAGNTLRDTQILRIAAGAKSPAP
jgi:branched-chain amino acid transport system substrate-binding protein